MTCVGLQAGIHGDRKQRMEKGGKNGGDVSKKGREGEKRGEKR